MYGVRKPPTFLGELLASLGRLIARYPAIALFHKLVAPRPWLAVLILLGIVILLEGPISPLQSGRDTALHIAPPSAIQGMMFTQSEQPPQANNTPPAPITGNAVPNPSAQFDTIIEGGLYPNEHAAMTSDLQDAYAYASERFGNGATSQFKAAVTIDEGCNLHGVAYTDERIVQVFSCNDLPRARAVAIMAHEFAHQFEQDRYGPAHLHSDMILSEGTATWAAGKYWLGDQADFRSYVREQRSSGVFYPLATNYNGLGIGAMNALYYQWASLVDFLITTYGRDKFDQVYVTGQSAPGSSDYAGVYGKGLDVLEQEWQAWLDQ
jgi:hypothetical protein